MPRQETKFEAGETFLTVVPVDEYGNYAGKHDHPFRTAGYKVRQYCVDLQTGEIIELRLSDGQPGSDG